MQWAQQFWRSRLAMAVALFVLTAATFLGASRCGFTNHDDPEYVYANPHVRTGLSLSNARWAFTSLNAEVSYWHPLTWLSHQLDCQLFGLKPGTHHLTSLWIHVANVLLLFHVLRQLGLGSRGAFFVAGLFAVHPLHVESVAWVAERKDVLYGFFWLLSLCLYLNFRQRRVRTAYWGALGSFAAALMSKPSAITLPAVLLLIELLVPSPGLVQSDRLAGAAWSVRLRALALRMFPILPFAVLSVGLAMLTLVAQRKVGALVSLEVQPFSERIDNALVAYATYIKKMFWPADLSVSYLQTHPHSFASIAIAFGLLALVTWWAMRMRRTEPLIAFGWFWFLLLLIPNIGLIQAGPQSMADRYTYLSLVGLFVVINVLARKFLPPSAAPIELLGFASLLVCASLSIAQLKYWKNGVALFQHAIEVQPDNWIAQTGLGMALTEQSRFDLALPHLERALELSGNSAEVHKKLGICLFWKGDAAHALNHFERSLEKNPASAETCFYVADILASDPDASVRNVERALMMTEQGVRLAGEPRADQWLTASAAYAAARRFAQAIQAAQRAQEMARTQPDPELLAEIQRRLLLYQQQKPFIRSRPSVGTGQTSTKVKTVTNLGFAAAETESRFAPAE